MKKLILPAIETNTVRILRAKLTDAAAAQRLWKRTDGVYKIFKEDVTSALKAIQSNRCAYCGARLYEKRPHRDHIAPKSPHYKWTFWPANLVLACYCCNVDCKNEVDTVTVVALTYKRTTFNIVHPFLDEPSEHLNFAIDKNAILIRSKNGSEKGKRTIELFRLMEPERAKQRAKDVLFDEDVAHLQGITRGKYLEAIQELNSVPIRMKFTS